MQLRSRRQLQLHLFSFAFYRTRSNSLYIFNYLCLCFANHVRVMVFEFEISAACRTSEEHHGWKWCKSISRYLRWVHQCSAKLCRWHGVWTRLGNRIETFDRNWLIYWHFVSLVNFLYWMSCCTCYRAVNCKQIKQFGSSLRSGSSKGYEINFTNFSHNVNIILGSLGEFMAFWEKNTWSGACLMTKESTLCIRRMHFN